MARHLLITFVMYDSTSGEGNNLSVPNIDLHQDNGRYKFFHLDPMSDHLIIDW